MIWLNLIICWKSFNIYVIEGTKNGVSNNVSWDCAPIFILLTKIGLLNTLINRFHAVNDNNNNNNNNNSNNNNNPETKVWLETNYLDYLCYSTDVWLIIN